jgi:putative transposase
MNLDTAITISQQLRETFPYDEVPTYLIFDRAANFNEEVVSTMKSFGIQPKRTSFRSPWQNGVAERWVGNCRRDLLDHVIVLNERHLRRLMTAYVRYYHEDRTHLALEKRTPAGSGGSGGYRCDLRSLSHAETRWPPPSLQPGRLSIDLGW